MSKKFINFPRISAFVFEQQKKCKEKNNEEKSRMGKMKGERRRKIAGIFIIVLGLVTEFE